MKLRPKRVLTPGCSRKLFLVTQDGNPDGKRLWHRRLNVRIEQKMLRRFTQGLRVLEDSALVVTRAAQLIPYESLQKLRFGKQLRSPFAESGPERVTNCSFAEECRRKVVPQGNVMSQTPQRLPHCIIPSLPHFISPTGQDFVINPVDFSK